MSRAPSPSNKLILPLRKGSCQETGNLQGRFRALRLLCSHSHSIAPIEPADRTVAAVLTGYGVPLITQQAIVSPAGVNPNLFF